MYDSFAFVHEARDASRTYMEWEGRFHGNPVSGATILSYSENGLIREIQLYHRPYAQVLATQFCPVTCYQRSARMHGARPGVSPTLAGQGGAHGRLDGSLRDPQWDAGYPLRSPESTGSRSRRRRPEAELGG